MAKRERNRERRREETPEFEEKVIAIARTSKVVKGGRRFGFRVVVVIGDGDGRVGIGTGKAREVPSAIRKGVESAKRNMITVPMLDHTIPHIIEARDSAAHVMLKPAAPGTGVIAGGGVRAVVEAAGIQNILTKSLGSDNTINVVRATFKALKSLKVLEEEAVRRGKSVSQVAPPWWHVAEAING
ncbi:MAG: 30S ribosomal protein S5 [Anaerolineales bacterium]|nr:30S ribosomal protein S5 [Anaerolineales bacterium]MCB9127212.1 30S ribosomal protein S5 [Ardenticatenales bacterium]MCB9171968.1 30S ribosomal protein S5 [Ardenticatenales bacterium]